MARIKPFQFVSDAYQELTHVVWPTRSEVIKKTITVILAIIIGGAFIGSLDYLLSQGVKFILNI